MSQENIDNKVEESSWHEAPTQGEPVKPQSRKVIVVLENASLEAARLVAYRHDSKMQLLNCDEHQSILKRLGRDIADARPDIVHQVCCWIIHICLIMY
jgi:rRNA small subunit pseudouridine methyltransferase Nep1